MCEARPLPDDGEKHMPTADNFRLTKQERRETAREEARKLREAQERRAKRNRTLLIVGLAVGLIAVAALVWGIVAAGNKSALDGVTRPQGSDLTGGIPVGMTLEAGTDNSSVDARVVNVYLDYTCSYCAQFEEINAADLKTLAKDGTATVVIHPVSILDRSGDYSGFSGLAANAAATVADRAPAQFLDISPPLVFAGEADQLKLRMAAAGRGEAFVLQGGDCAESFAANTADHIRHKIMTILQMAVVLTYGASLPIVKMGRMAGQYAKPRSADTEVRDGVELPAFRGDAVNDHEFTPESRIPDPHRLVRAYNASASTLNLIRAFTYGGFADLRRVHEWNKGFMRNPAYSRYEVLAAEIDRAVRFMGAAGVDFDAIRTVDFYSAHEALLMEYERALTRIDSRTGHAYDCSAHFLWIGERTRQLDGAHVDLLSRVENPIGCKLGPTATADDARALIDRLNPCGAVSYTHLRA